MQAIQAGHPIAFMIGGMIGALIPIILVSILVEKVFSSMVFDDPVIGKGFSVLIAFVLCSAIAALNRTGWRGFDPWAFVQFAPACIIVGAVFIRRGFLLRGMQEELEAGLANPPDYEAARPFE